MMGAIAISIAMRSSSEELGNGKMIGAGVLFIVGAMLSGVLGLPNRDNPRGNEAAVILGILVGLVGAGLMVKLVIDWAKHSQDKSYAAFYQECRSNRISSFDSPKNQQKGELIAKKHKLPTQDLHALYAKGQAICGQKAVAEQDEKTLHMRRAEQEACDTLNAFSQLHGREKRIAMLSRERSSYLHSASDLIVGTDALMKASMQKEHDVAINAGIASGIAGGAWGAVTAVDTMNKNAAIRAHNEAVKESFKPMQDAAMRAAGNNYDMAARLAKEIEAAKTKLVAEDTPEECLARLTFTDTKVTVSELGSCTVKTTTHAAPFLIFDDVDAVVDGTVLAELYDGARKIGAAKLVLPVHGAGKSTKLKGMCLFCGQKGGQYQVKFRAENLWAMER